MYGYYLNILTVAFLVIGVINVALSFWPSRVNYWIAILLFSTIAIALPLFIAFGLIAAIGIGYAFSSRAFPVTALIPPLIIFTYFIASGFSLYPFISLRTTKRIGIICHVFILPLILIFYVYILHAQTAQIFLSINHAYLKEALIFVLIWLRLYDLKKVMKSINTPSIPPAHAI